MNGIKKEIKMGKEAILQSIKKNKPELLPLPEINETIFSGFTPLSDYIEYEKQTSSTLFPTKTLNVSEV